MGEEKERKEGKEERIVGIGSTEMVLSTASTIRMSANQLHRKRGTLHVKSRFYGLKS
jgi:hypothetical protein